MKSPTASGVTNGWPGRRRCANIIVAAASASAGDETNARFVVAFKWWSLCCPLAEVNRFFCNAEDPDV
jgi:hypothetical protein